MPSDLLFWTVEERARNGRGDYIFTCGEVAVAVDALHGFWEASVVAHCCTAWPAWVIEGELHCPTCGKPLLYPEGTVGRLFWLFARPSLARECVQAWLAGRVDPLLASLAAEELLALLATASGEERVS